MELDHAARLVHGDIWGDDYEFVGESLTGMGDLDADGYDDFAVGAWGASTLWVVNGPVTGNVELDDAGTTIVITDRLGAVTGLGEQMARAGDLTGDGIEDLVASTSAYDWLDDAGHDNVFLFAGPFTAADTDADWAAVYRGADSDGGARDWLDVSDFDAACDVDGDGQDDLALVTYGSADGADALRIVTGPLSGTHDLDEPPALLATGDGYHLGGPRMLGDVDGDGRCDVSAGKPDDSTWAEDGGSATVLLGQADVEDMGDHAVATVYGADAGDMLGRAVSEAIDLDADGAPDLAVSGTPYDGDEGYGVGAVWVFRGPLSGTITTEDAASRIDSDLSLSYGSLDLPRNAGDVDGDGTDDLIASDFYAGLDLGAAYVFLGQSEGR